MLKEICFPCHEPIVFCHNNMSEGNILLAGEKDDRRLQVLFFFKVEFKILIVCIQDLKVMHFYFRWLDVTWVLTITERTTSETSSHTCNTTLESQSEHMDREKPFRTYIPTPKEFYLKSLKCSKPVISNCIINQQVPIFRKRQILFPVWRDKKRDDYQIREKAKLTCCSTETGKTL